MAPAKLQTRGVLAGAYRTRDPRSMLTHAVDADTSAPLCTRVQLDSICDMFAYTDAELAAEPTCKCCAKRWAAARAAGAVLVGLPD